MDEFDFIATYLAPLAGKGGLSLADDAAILTPRVGKDLILTKDAMVEGVHFPKGHYGGDTAEKLLRVNLSDLAAKGARPLGYLLSIVWPDNIDPLHFQGFAAGLSDVQKAYDFELLGGDTTRSTGPMVVSATLIGEVPKGTMVTRSGAQIGDDIWVSGSLGDAYLGLQNVLGTALDPAPSAEAIWHFEEAYYRPEPRLLLRKALRSHATACADISDGMLADAGHIAKASGRRFDIELETLPLSPFAQDWAQNDTERLTALITAGDDYELVFTAPASMRKALSVQGDKIGCPLTRVGTVRDGLGVRLRGTSGQEIKVTKTGFKHF